MSIPIWIINTLAVIGFFFVWVFIAALIGVPLGKFFKDEE